jgi:hypothetical protein
MQSFTLPPEDDDADGAPDAITHGVDYMLTAPKTAEFYYNFLVYTWTIAGETVTARAYLDDIAEVAVFLPAHRLDEPAFAPPLRYLMRRYRVIKTFGGGETYKVAYRR